MTWRVVLLLAIGLGLSARGSEPLPVLTLEECIRLGLEQSASATNSRRDQAIARTLSKQAGSEALPQLSLNGRYLRNDVRQKVDFGGQSMEIGLLDNYSAQTEVSQLLYSGGRLTAAIRAADISRDLADAKLREKESEIVRNIRIGFLDVLLARAGVGVRVEHLAQTEALLAQTEQRNRSGAASDFDVLSARVRVQNERPDLIRARNDLELTLEALRRLVTVDGREFDVAGELAFTPVRVDLGWLIATGLQKRAAVVVMQKVVALRAQDMAAARAKSLPEVRATAAYGGANSYGFGADDEWQWHWNAVLSASWSIWDGGLTRATVAQKRLELLKSQTDLDDLENGVRFEIREAFLEMTRAAETVEMCRGGVELAEKSLQIARVRYDEGLTTQLEFTDANLGVGTARWSWLRALRDHGAAVTRLQHASGVARAEFQEVR